MPTMDRQTRCHSSTRKDRGSPKLVSPQLSALYTGIATLHKDKDLHEAFAAALKAIMTSGEYQAILTKWGFEGLKGSIVHCTAHSRELAIVLSCLLLCAPRYHW